MCPPYFVSVSDRHAAPRAGRRAREARQARPLFRAPPPASWARLRHVFQGVLAPSWGLEALCGFRVLRHPLAGTFDFSQPFPKPLGHVWSLLPAKDTQSQEQQAQQLLDPSATPTTSSP
jgi:hypothetical protein